jgi:hypothetical protein
MILVLCEEPSCLGEGGRLFFRNLSRLQTGAKIFIHSFTKEMQIERIC